MVNVDVSKIKQILNRQTLARALDDIIRGTILTPTEIIRSEGGLQDSQNHKDRFSRIELANSLAALLEVGIPAVYYKVTGQLPLYFVPLIVDAVSRGTMGQGVISTIREKLGAVYMGNSQHNTKSPENGYSS